jgi:hypothetical protein
MVDTLNFMPDNLMSEEWCWVLAVSIDKSDRSPSAFIQVSQDKQELISNKLSNSAAGTGRLKKNP